MRVLDLLLIVAALGMATHARQTIHLGQPLAAGSGLPTFAVYAMVMCAWIGASGFTGLYRARRSISPVDQSALAAWTSFVVCGLFAGVLYLTVRDVSRLLFAYFLLFSTLGLISVRWILVVLLRFWPVEQRVAIIGTGPLARIVALVQRTPFLGMPRTRLVGLIRAPEIEAEDDPMEPPNVLGNLKDLEGLVRTHAIGEIVIALTPCGEHTRSDLVRRLRDLGVDVRIVLDLAEVAATQFAIEEADGIPVIRLRQAGLNPWEQAKKRAFDLVVSAILLVLLAPLMAAIAAAVWLESRGPVLFRASRVGLGGRPFTMYKFRSMVWDAEQQLSEILAARQPGHGVYKVPADPRTTRLGRLLRRTSLDELPQLFNVLRGDMTLVGPRPEQPFVVAEYRAWQWRRLEARPGVTGWWQVMARDRPMNLHTEYDLYYLHSYSFVLDLKILARTFRAVIQGRGAY